MPVNITDVDQFTDPIVGPADSDPADRTYVMTIAQGLANRTRYIHNRGGYGGLSSGGGDVSPPVGSFTPVTWWDSALPVDGQGLVQANLGADGLFVPNGGVFEAHCHFSIRAPSGFGSNTVPDLYAVAIAVDGAESPSVRILFNVEDAADWVNVAFGGIVTVGAGELVTVRVRAENLDGGGGPYTLTAGNGGAFWIRQLA